VLSIADLQHIADQEREALPITSDKKGPLSSDDRGKADLMQAH
jgi:hypothetical protein